MYNIGVMYSKGHGVEVSHEEQFKWYRKSADLGLVNAIHGVGICYHNGFGVPKDDFEAMRWFVRSAAMGNMRSQKMVDSLKKSVNVFTIS